jgi:hypothetical protein
MKVFESNQIDLRIINSKTYKYLYPYLVAGFFISYFLSFVFLLPISLIIGLVVLNILIPVAMIVYAKNFKELGRLSIDHQNIVIALNGPVPLIVPIAILEDLKISRGSTVHIEEKGIYPSETHDNWISFTYNKKAYKYEFSILNQKENALFEMMIYRLKTKYPNFQFTSI